VERGQHLALRVLFKINQQVAATDQVHPREGRIAEQILPGEDDHLAQELGGAVAAVLLRKEAPQPFRREVVEEAFGIKTGAGFIEQRLVKVGGKKLQLARVAACSENSTNDMAIE